MSSKKGQVEVNWEDQQDINAFADLIRKHTIMKASMEDKKVHIYFGPGMGSATVNMHMLWLAQGVVQSICTARPSDPSPVLHAEAL
jgi:hypothetical protein